jgi:hypothetical protein
MVGTVRAARHGGRALAGGAFTLGLALGAAALFASLGALGAALRPGHVVVLAAVTLAGAAALADLAGLRVRPQVPFQVPERWRRTMPLARALFLYGLLLGTGVTTFVPAAAVWALLPLCVALGSVPLGVAVGLGFALGRALPVLALSDETALAERPQGLRVLRVLAAVSLALALVAGTARAAAPVAAPASDPGAAGTDLVWEEPGVGGILLRAGVQTHLPGSDPAIGDSFIAWHTGDAVTVAASDTLQPVLQVTIHGVEKLAVSEKWLAYRAAGPSGSEHIGALALSDPSTTIAVTKSWRRGRLGRPSLSGEVVVYHLALPGKSHLFAFDLATRKRTLLRSSRRALLLSPARIGGTLLYVRLGRCSQQLRLGRLDGNGAGRVLYKLPPLAGQDLGHEHGHTEQGSHVPCPGRPRPTKRSLWTTALSETSAYVTVLHPSGGGHTIPSLLAVTLAALR